MTGAFSSVTWLYLCFRFLCQRLLIVERGAEPTLYADQAGLQDVRRCGARI